MKIEGKAINVPVSRLADIRAADSETEHIALPKR